MKTNREDLAIRLTEERSRLGYSQADFARRLDMSREGLRLYETGQRGMGAEFLAAAATIGLDVQNVVTGVRSMNASDGGGATVLHVNSKGPVVGFVHQGATVNQIHNHHHVTKTVADVKPGEEHISEQQAAHLHELVARVISAESRTKEKPVTHRAVWSRLNARCKVTQYRLIRKEDFDLAVQYLQQWIDRAEDVASQRANQTTARTRLLAYIRIHTQHIEREFLSYLKRAFRTNRLDDLDDEQLREVHDWVSEAKGMIQPGR